MDTFKIGQMIEVSEDFEIQSFSDQKIQVKKGDKGFIDSRGALHYTTGKARGKIHIVEDIKTKGYDTENIAELIYQRLQGYFNIKEALEDNDIDKKDFIGEIDDVLSDIL